MRNQNLFKWRHCEADIILLCVRWSLRYSLSSRNLEEMMLERGLQVDHTTIDRWVQRSAPELEKRCRPHLTATHDSWRVDETSIQVKQTWMYLYRAVDSEGNTLEFLLSPTRAAEAAKRFFSKTLAAFHTVEPRVIAVDTNAAYPQAFQELKEEGTMPKGGERRPVNYLNTLLEQDHRFIKRLVKPGMGFFAFETAWRTLQGHEALNMFRKGQLCGVEKGDILRQVACIARLFGMAASAEQEDETSCPWRFSTSVCNTALPATAPGCLPLFTSDGLDVYFSALTAHVGPWLEMARQGRKARQWQVAAGLISGQVKKSSRRRKLVRVTHVMRLGTDAALQVALQGLGLSGRLTPACRERVNLTVRHGVAALARRTWASRSPPHNSWPTWNGGEPPLLVCVLMHRSR